MTAEQIAEVIAEQAQACRENAARFPADAEYWEILARGVELAGQALARRAER